MPVDPSEKPLDARESRFVDEYLIDLDPERAAVAAGYSPSTAHTKAYMWVSNGKTKPHVFAAIQRGKAERAERTRITADRVVEELGKVGFASMRRFIRIDGAGNPIIDLSETPDDHLDALSAIETEAIRQDAGDGDPVTTIVKTKIKLHDKLKALHDLAEHTGVFKESDKNKATALAEAFQQIWARGSKAPLRRGGPPK